MSNNYRVLNITTGERTKYKQALKRIEGCLWTWVEIGKTVRSLTLEEQLAALAEQKKNAEPLVGAELTNPQLKFVPPITAGEYIATHRGILGDTRRFFNEATAPANA